MNLDERPDANFVCDLNGPLPLPDDTVDEVYSAHCLEHVDGLEHIVREIVRVCKVGAVVEIRVPHWNSSMACCQGHRQTISEMQVFHFEQFVDHWFPRDVCKKCLELENTEYVPSAHFPRAKELHPNWRDEDIFRYLADTCHEIRFLFQVQPR